MDKIELIVLVCTTCSGVFAVEAEWMKECEEPVECFYCGSCATGTMVSSEGVN